MTNIQYLQEFTSQMATVSGILAGFSFAVLFQLYTSENQHKLDGALVALFLISSLALILAAAMGGFMIPIFGFVAAENGRFQLADFELTQTCFQWMFLIGFLALFLGIGLGGFRFNGMMGCVALVLTFCAIVVFLVTLSDLRNAVQKGAYRKTSCVASGLSVW